MVGLWEGGGDGMYSGFECARGCGEGDGIVKESFEVFFFGVEDVDM